MSSIFEEPGKGAALSFKPLPSMAKQDLLLEFASLKQGCPDGVFVTITPGNTSLWNGILFVRKGPYAPSILRFQMSFPAQYPSQPPLITFTSDIFHPLLTPLTTYTYTTSAADSDETVSASDQERLPPGGFSLRHGFPRWFTPVRNSMQRLEETRKGPISVYQILEYLRYAFNDESCLDTIPVNAAANPGAYHAWNNYKARLASRAASPHPSSKRNSGIDHLSGSNDPSRGRRPGEWNWDGVWEDRVRKGVQSTVSEQALFGGTGMDEMVRFSTLDRESYEIIMAEIEKRESDHGTRLFLIQLKYPLKKIESIFLAMDHLKPSSLTENLVFISENGKTGMSLLDKAEITEAAGLDYDISCLYSPSKSTARPLMTFSPIKVRKRRGNIPQKVGKVSQQAPETLMGRPKLSSRLSPVKLGLQKENSPPKPRLPCGSTVYLNSNPIFRPNLCGHDVVTVESKSLGRYISPNHRPTSISSSTTDDTGRLSNNDHEDDSLTPRPNRSNSFTNRLVTNFRHISSRVKARSLSKEDSHQVASSLVASENRDFDITSHISSTYKDMEPRGTSQSRRHSYHFGLPTPSAHVRPAIRWFAERETISCNETISFRVAVEAYADVEMQLWRRDGNSVFENQLPPVVVAIIIDNRITSSTPFINKAVDCIQRIVNKLNNDEDHIGIFAVDKMVYALQPRNEQKLTEALQTLRTTGSKPSNPFQDPISASLLEISTLGQKVTFSQPAIPMIIILPSSHGFDDCLETINVPSHIHLHFVSPGPVPVSPPSRNYPGAWFLELSSEDADEGILEERESWFQRLLLTERLRLQVGELKNVKLAIRRGQDTTAVSIVGDTHRIIRAGELQRRNRMRPGETITTVLAVEVGKMTPTNKATFIAELALERELETHVRNLMEITVKSRSSQFPTGQGGELELMVAEMVHVRREASRCLVNSCESLSIPRISVLDNFTAVAVAAIWAQESPLVAWQAVLDVLRRNSRKSLRHQRRVSEMVVDDLDHQSSFIPTSAATQGLYSIRCLWGYGDDEEQQP